MHCNVVVTKEQGIFKKLYKLKTFFHFYFLYELWWYWYIGTSITGIILVHISSQQQNTCYTLYLNIWHCIYLLWTKIRAIYLKVSFSFFFCSDIGFRNFGPRLNESKLPAGTHPSDGVSTNEEKSPFKEPNRHRMSLALNSNIIHFWSKYP